MKEVARISREKPQNRGLLKLYGEALVRVRVYHDDVRLKRVRTVELILDEEDLVEPTTQVASPQAMPDKAPPMMLSEEGFRAALGGRTVFIRVEEPAPSVLSALAACGAVYHGPSCSWVLRREDAELLGLLVPQLCEWIVETLPEPLPVGMF